jgi:hypothetical protein
VEDDSFLCTANLLHQVGVGIRRKAMTRLDHCNVAMRVSVLSCGHVCRRSCSFSSMPP